MVRFVFLTERLLLITCNLIKYSKKKLIQDLMGPEIFLKYLNERKVSSTHINYSNGLMKIVKKNRRI